MSDHLIGALSNNAAIFWGDEVTSSNKIIEFKGHHKTSQNHADTTAPGDVLDMTERRSAIISQERRKVKRTILAEFIGAWVVVPEIGLTKCSIYDISETGIAIDLEERSGHFPVGESVALRIYLSQKVYISFIVAVENLRLEENEMLYRHGCSWVKGSYNNEALTHFVKFIESVSTSLHSDSGDIFVPDFTE